jgi:hypothetical protein
VPVREPAAEQFADQLDRVAAGDAVAHGEGGDGGLQAGAEGAPGNAARKLGARLGGTLGAAHPVQGCSLTLTAIGGNSQT